MSLLPANLLALCLLVVAAVSTAPASDIDSVGEAEWFWSDESAEPQLMRNSVVSPASFQPRRALTPPPRPASLTPRPQASLPERLLEIGVASDQLPLQRELRTFAPGTNVIYGAEARARAAGDPGSLIGKSPSGLGIAVQKRNSQITDTRPRSSTVGQQTGSGSHWLPARIDLDTLLSKLDPRDLDDTIVVKGPYSALYGPDLRFVDFALLRSPRFASPHGYGSSGVEYQTNGQQWYGRQVLGAGAADWGLRASYGLRGGQDYQTGNYLSMPAGYRSGCLDLAAGWDPAQDQQMEVNYLRLDQSDVELPGQAFDIESLTTNGISVQYSWEQSFGLDHVELALWYNRTRLDGDNRRPAKRRQFPIYDDRDFVAETDVDSLSLGYRLAGTWGDVDCPHLTAGTDLRSVEQELNEIAISGTVGPIHLDGNNSPIPRSRTVDPGIFVEQVLPVTEATTLKAGGRVDYFCAAPLKDVWQLGPIGTKGQPYPNVVGTDDVKHDRLLWLLYLVSRTAFDEHWSVTLGAGHSERPPNLTELYVAESFMFLLQNGLNTVTGDPLLRPERLWQLDASVSFTSARLRWEATGFLAWIQDKITFENLSVVGEPNQPVDQVNLKYVNTALATLAGVELRGRCLLRPWLTAFATLSYVAGEDWTRNGDFATDQVSLTEPSSRVYGLPRGFFSGVSGGVHEPLPGIAPLESRVGLTVHDSTERPRWAVELSCRMVDSQDRVASSLLEQPTPGFVVWDVRSFFRVTKHWLLATGVENVGNRTYREHLDFRPAGPAAADRFTMYQPGVNIYWVSELSY